MPQRLSEELTEFCTARAFGKRMKSEKMIPSKPLKKFWRLQESTRLVVAVYITLVQSIDHALPVVSKESMRLKKLVAVL